MATLFEFQCPCASKWAQYLCLLSLIVPDLESLMSVSMIPMGCCCCQVKLMVLSGLYFFLGGPSVLPGCIHARIPFERTLVHWSANLSMMLLGLGCPLSLKYWHL
jgi:hypothetical protein